MSTGLPAVVNIQKRFPGNDSLLRVWAPQTIYDAKDKKYMIYWSMKHGNDPDIIYYAYANEIFTDFETDPNNFFIIHKSAPVLMEILFIRMESITCFLKQKVVAMV